MALYKETDGTIRHIEDDGSQDHLIQPDWVVANESDIPKPVIDLEAVERIWRDSELARADIELYKVQDGGGTGTVSEWRDYRVVLRDYPQQPKFPKGNRPVAPDDLA